MVYGGHGALVCPGVGLVGAVPPRGEAVPPHCAEALKRVWGLGAFLQAPWNLLKRGPRSPQPTVLLIVPLGCP